MTARRLAAVALAAALTLLAAPPTSAAAHRAPADNCVQPGESEVARPWPQAVLGHDTVWPFTRGAGTTIAVLGTGVDGTLPQLGRRVDRGYDAVANRAGADTDCSGLGTQVAAVAAADQLDPGGFAGLAPRATIVPVRVVPDTPGGGAAEPAPLARGITWAAARDVDVIVVTTPVRDDAGVRAAVSDALADDIVIVASAGDLGAPSKGNPTSYPAAYPGVLGVGAIAQDGRVWSNSQHGDYVDLVAPGVAVPTLQRGTGLTEVDGTAVAAGFVAAAAALTKSKRGTITPGQVTSVLRATASPAALGPSYGAGVVNPYAAVTDQVTAARARPLPALSAVPADASPGWLRRRDLALAGAGIAALAVVAVLIMAAAMRRGRRRAWRPAIAPHPEQRLEPDEPGPPLMLLDDPETPARR